HTVTAAEAEMTLPALLRELVPGTSWSRARELCRGGRVLVDGAAASHPPPRRLALPATAIVHFDAELVVVKKPAGMLTVPFTDEDRDTLVTLTRAALSRLEAARGGRSGRSKMVHGPRLRVVQRLDKETSGLLVFARTIAAERHLQQQFRLHSVHRVYLALIHGALVRRGVGETVICDTLLVPDRGDGLRGSWGVFRRPRGEPPEAARRAVPHVTVEEPRRGASLASCRLETGRQHQIRIHLAEAGHPLLGEKVYVRDYAGPLLAAPRPMLHAAELGFVHPPGEREMLFEEPPPSDFDALLARLRGRA